MTTTPETQIGVRHLEVLGEFKPFGLIAEALDGNPIDDAVSEKYDYFLFDPQVVAALDESDGFGAVDDDPGFVDGAEHELFIRGKRIIWTSGSRVLKKLTLKSSAIMACWCHLGDLSQAMLCVLEVGSLTIFNTSGEFTSIPLPGMITSIWPLPFGLLLQQAAESRCPAGAASTSSSLLSSQKNTFSSKKELRHSPMRNYGLWNYDSIVKGTLSSTSSHLVLNGLVEEPQNVFVEERGSLNVMHDFDERTIWTSDYVPLMASFNREKMQHSVWSLVRAGITQREKISSLSEELSPEAYAKQFSLRRIWVAKVSCKAAAKVFLATDDDAVPVICFLLQEQKRLMLVRLSYIENGDEVLVDIRLQISWIESVVAAEPVAVTLSRAKAQGFPVADIIALAPEGVLLLYSGKQCLCKFMLPSYFGRPKVSLSSMPSDCITLPPVKVVGLADAARGRINVILNSGQMLRCSLHRGPQCSLTNDCMKALAAGLCSNMYSRFLRVLWGHDISLGLKHDNYANDWKLFSSIIKLMIGTADSSSEHASDVDQYSAWDFLVNSEFHRHYGDGNLMPFRETGNVTDLCFASSTRQEQQSHKKPFYKEFLIECLNCLHAIYENLKLINTRKRDLELLVVLLFEIADFLREEKYVEHYVRDFPFLSSKARSCKMALSQRVAPSLYRWLKNCLMHGLSHTKADDIPLLVRKEGSSVVGLARKVVAFYSLLSGERCASKKLASGVYCNVASGSVSCPEEQTVLAMVGEGFGLQQLDLLPVGLSLPLRHALFKCRECPPSDWPEAAYVLLGREDLALSCTSKLRKNLKPETQTRVKYYSESVPYILQLSPVAIPATMSETFGSENRKLEDADSVDGPVTDGMEHIFNASTRFRYGRDLRLNEVRCLLSSSRHVPIHACVNSSASEQELQQAQLWQISQRTTALPLGRGAFTLATTCSLLTEALAVPKLVLAGRLPTQQNAMVNLEHNLRNVQDLQVWPEFHNAVAAGLCLAPMQGKMSRTWILYNRSAESSPMHAGLLLALGLQGHLTVLTITDVYRYYQQEHESTTVGLMLGLAASYRGTMELTMSKSFYVHLPSKHPSSFPELEVPTLIQGEVGRRSGGDNVLEREGYAVSAGFSLGIVGLGLGKDCLPWIESTVDRLFHFAGDRAFHPDTSSLLPITDESRSSSQVLEGVPVNVDVTAPGAIVALTLMFLKTESEVVASRLSIPSTLFELQYVRPDFIMLRVIARNLIMWSRIEPSKEWIESQLPPVVSSGIECLRNDMFAMEDVDEEALVQAYVNIVTGLCISLGLKYAGSRNENAKELLYYYAIHFLNEIKPVSLTNGSSFLKGISKYVDRGTLEMCLHLTVLALSVVMAGSGNLEIFRFLKFLRSRNPADAHASYGMHMAVSLAIGFLFLGGGMLTFSTSSHAIAALLITLYPRLPSGPNDNRCHLQAYRHMYVLATEPRCIQTVDVDTGLPVYAPLEITVKETDNYIETSFCEVTPCILPERANLKAVRVCGPRYWPQVIELVPEDEAWWGSGVESHPFNSGILYVKRKVGACSYLDDPIGCQSLLSRAMHKAFSLTSTRACRSSGESASVQVDQLVSVFSSDPSLIAFAQLCCDPTWNNRSNNDFQEFCLQVLFDCVSKDRPALLQVYLSLYTAVSSMADQVHSEKLTDADSLLMLNLKLALAYSEAFLKGKLTSSIGGIVQPVFLSSMRNRVEEIFSYMPGLKDDFSNYMISGTWPTDGGRSIFLAWYLQWFDVPSPSVVQKAVERIQQKLGTSLSIPLLHLLLPKTHITVITVIHKIFCSIQG